MDEKGLLNEVKKIVFDVPDNLYKYQNPDKWLTDEEWANTPSMEKGFILIKEIIENIDIQNNNKQKNSNDETEETNVLNLGKGPTFWTNADEDMFFNAIYSMASYEKIVGQGFELFLYYKGQFSKEETAFLIGLLKRYRMKIPKELNKIG